MEDTLQRLKDSSEAAIKAYEVWGNSRKNQDARDRLQEAVHELRKVSARLEIEVAVSERDEMTQRPLPVPPHRAAKNRSPDIGNELPDFITEGGIAKDEPDDPNDRQPNDNQSGGLGRRPQQRSGGGGQGGPRRPVRRPYSGGGQGGSGSQSE